MGNSVKLIYPKLVNNDIELQSAIKTKCLAIISTDEKLFFELEAKFKKKKAADKTKKSGSLLSKLAMSAFTVSLFIPGLNGVVLMAELAAAGIGSLTKVVGSNLDDFKKYAMIIDYEKRRVILIKVKGKECFNQKKHKINGIDLKEIIRKNEQ